MEKQYVKISLDDYGDLLQQRFVFAQNEWGNENTRAMWESVYDLIMAQAPDMDMYSTNPVVLVDNYVVNSEIVSRDEFYDDMLGLDVYYKYKDFDKFADAEGLLRTEDHVLLNFGF